MALDVKCHIIYPPLFVLHPNSYCFFCTQCCIKNLTWTKKKCVRVTGALWSLKLCCQFKHYLKLGSQQSQHNTPLDHHQYSWSNQPCYSKIKRGGPLIYKGCFNQRLYHLISQEVKRARFFLLLAQIFPAAWQGKKASRYNNLSPSTHLWATYYFTG